MRNNLNDTTELFSCAAIPVKAMGLSAVCDCVISRPYSLFLTIVAARILKTNFNFPYKIKFAFSYTLFKRKVTAISLCGKYAVRSLDCMSGKIQK